MLWFLLASLVLTFAVVVIGLRLDRSFALFRVRKHYTAAVTAPSVSICIPARNETHAMTQCLERVLASDYKKMEIIVYDDSSTDDTSIVIRSFAHAGVRFVPGTRLPEGWLGKNHALEVLGREASGTYLVFMDVDTYIQPTTISQLVGYTMTEKLGMVSVIPGRNDLWRTSVLFGHLRYFWELVFSRASAPATSSALWITDRHLLFDTFGGFEAIKSSVAPEASLASKLGTERYHCLVSDASLGVTYEKKWSSQVETSKRLYYPRSGGTWLHATMSLAGLLLLNLPLWTVLSGFFFGWTMMQVMALWFMLAFMAIYGVYTYRIWGHGWWLGGLLWSLVIFQELVLYVASLWGYARRSVTWKGRTVTVHPAN
jgi:chlorobactene glucosyltransferase